MKKNYLEKNRLSITFILLLTVVFSSCEIDDFTEVVPDGDANTAPTITLLSPGDTVRIILLQDELFEISAEVADNSPGLSLFSATILDSLGNEVYQKEEQLTGVSIIATISVPDSILAVGANYDLEVFVEDTQGRRAEATSSFVGIGLLKNQEQIFVIGNFTGWGDTGAANYRDIPMTLVADYTWEAAAWLDEAAPQFKFVDNNSFGGSDWGDDGPCDGIADGGGNITCPVTSNNVVFRFNDQTLAYEIIELSANYDEMFVLGEYNGWGNSEDRFTLVADNQWEVDLNFSGPWKIVADENFGVDDWGDGGCDGVAEPGGANIECDYDGDFKIRFNDDNLNYSVEPL